MSGKSKIEWTDRTWNPVTGCTKISAGCKNCYAERMSKRLAGRCGYPADDPFKVTLHPDRLEEPLHWKKPSRIFICSMADLFHEDVPDEFILRVFRRVDECVNNAHYVNGCGLHTFIFLTKRPQRMKYMVKKFIAYNGQPSSNVHSWFTQSWFGVTAENQEMADERIPVLLKIPDAVRFVSVEPMLGPVNLTAYLPHIISGNPPSTYTSSIGPDWVICGGETGPGARPIHPDWARSLRDQCAEANVPFFFKQWGKNAGYLYDGKDYDPKNKPNDFDIKKIAMRSGKLLDGKEHREFPK